MTRPLFIPLKAEFFDAFERGDKVEEFRKAGPRWNADVCTVGRAVILSCGYGRQRRRTGRITGFRYDPNPQSRPGWLACYGPGPATAACIRIDLDP